jgi:hypothetical protein
MRKPEEHENRQNKSWLLSLVRLFDTGQLRGCIGERLVNLYINDELIPSLKKNEGWTDILYIRAWYHEPRSFPNFDEYRPHITEGMETEARKELWERMKKSIKFMEEMEARTLLDKGFYPTKEFLKYFKKLTASLSHTADGFLIKMKRTETTKTINEAIREFELVDASENEFIEGLNFQKIDKNRMLPVVNGKIEMIEVKTGSKEGISLQTSSYRNAAANGFPLRFFHVDLNSFLIQERLIVNSNEITSNCFKDAKNMNIIQVSFSMSENPPLR